MPNITVAVICWRSWFQELPQLGMFCFYLKFKIRTSSVVVQNSMMKQDVKDVTFVCRRTHAQGHP